MSLIKSDSDTPPRVIVSAEHRAAQQIPAAAAAAAATLSPLPRVRRHRRVFSRQEKIASVRRFIGFGGRSTIETRRSPNKRVLARHAVIARKLLARYHSPNLITDEIIAEEFPLAISRGRPRTFFVDENENLFIKYIMQNQPTVTHASLREQYSQFFGRPIAYTTLTRFLQRENLFLPRREQDNSERSPDDDDSE